jgi:hypothetical protein
VADPHVGEQAPVAVAGLDVELEPDGPPGDQRGIHAGGGGTAGSAAARRTISARLVRDLGRVHADVAHALYAIADRHVDRVTVVDVRDARREGARRGPRGGARNGERDQDAGDADRQARCDTPHLAHAGIRSPSRQRPQSWTAAGTGSPPPHEDIDAYARR